MLYLRSHPCLYGIHSHACLYGKPPFTCACLWNTSNHTCAFMETSIHTRVFMEYLHSYTYIFGIPTLIHMSLWNTSIHTRVFMEYRHSYTRLYGISPLTRVILRKNSIHTRAYMEYFYSYMCLHCTHRDSITFTMYIHHGRYILRKTYKMQVKTCLIHKPKSSGL